MDERFDLQKYLTEGVEQVIKDALKATLKDPRESAFLVKFAAACAVADRRRAANEKQGLHVPSYLIASITSSCNLHCEGCYSRANDATNDCKPSMQLTEAEWQRIFDEAEELGVSFILLAGGEPMLRWDVIESAGRMKNILFPVFTNGTFMTEEHLGLLDSCRNIVPVISIEGGREETDARRGEGVFDTVIEKMDKLCEKGIIYGVSVTVTKENMGMVYSDAFLDELRSRGCKAVFYIEFVPVEEEGAHLAPDDADRGSMSARIDELRANKQDMIYISFPGDEKSSGGCLAAGRGFFHINSHGGAEPCPFSPYSDINVRDTSLRDALQSNLFTALRTGDILSGEHIGGCVLHAKRDQVEALL
ncbi:MAG: radical SAM protein [Clostridiales bacterium]|nr:radical SAM protein [Clostridiales bacterium]